LREAGRDLLIEQADVAVGLTVERNRNGRIVDRIFLAIADAQEGRTGRSDLPVEAQIALI
jgi:hypothetical protein